jgi:hypothetical protein
MNAFDQVWDLIVKMPVVPGSLYSIEPREDVSQKPTRSWRALFRDPETDVIEPMIIDYIERLNSWGDTMRSYQGQIGEGIDRGKLKYRDEDDRFVSEDGELESATPDDRKSITSVNWVGDWNYGNQAYPAWTETREGLRGRGYAPSLYDVIAYLMDKHQKTPLHPSTEQSGSAQNMWAKRSEMDREGIDAWPVRDDL